MRPQRACGGLQRLSLKARGDFAAPAQDLLPRAISIRLLVHAVVDLPAERVHRADCIALVGGERVEREREMGVPR